MNARLLLFFRPLSFVVWFGLLTFASYKFYNEPIPPEATFFQVAYGMLHGMLESPRKDRLNLSQRFVLPGSSADAESSPYYCLLRSITFRDESTDVDLTLYRQDQDVLRAAIELVATPTLEMASNVYPLTSATTHARDPGLADVQLVFSAMPAVSGDITLMLSSGLSFTLAEASLTRLSRVEPDGTNVWGYLAAFAAYCLLLTYIGSRGGNKKFLDGVLREWRPFDDERKLVAERCGLADDPATLAQRRASANACLDESERLILSHYERALMSQSSTSWALVALCLICIAAAAFLFVPHSPTPAVALAGSATASTNSPLVERISDLEQGRTLPREILVAVIVIGFVAVGCNYVVSIWRAKQAARQVIQSRLARFDIRLRASVDEGMSASCNALAALESQLAGMSKKTDELKEDWDASMRLLRQELQSGADGIVAADRAHREAVASRLKRSIKNAARSAA
jgi:hypothetical protein